MSFGVSDTTSHILRMVPITPLEPLKDPGRTRHPLILNPINKLFHGVFELYEQAYSKRNLALINRECFLILFDEIKQLKQEIVKRVDKIQEDLNSASRMSTCVSLGYYIQVLKVYYSVNPVMLNNWEKRVESDKHNTNILHDVFGTPNETVCVTFTPFVLKLNQIHNLGLVDQRDHNGMLPIHVLCGRNGLDDKIKDYSLQLLLETESGRKQINAFINSYIMYPTIYNKYPNNRLINTEVSPLFQLIKHSRKSWIDLDKDIDPFTKENVLLLIENGADVNLINNEGDTILHILAKSYFSTYIPLFVEQGGDLESKNKREHSPLDAAFDMFFEDGNPIDVVKDKFTKTVLMLFELGAQLTPFLRQYNHQSRDYAKLPQKIKDVMDEKILASPSLPPPLPPTTVPLPVAVSEKPFVVLDNVPQVSISVVSEVELLPKVEKITTPDPDVNPLDVEPEPTENPSELPFKQSQKVSRVTVFGLFRSMAGSILQLLLVPFRALFLAIFNLFKH